MADDGRCGWSFFLRGLGDMGGLAEVLAITGVAGRTGSSVAVVVAVLDVLAKSVLVFLGILDSTVAVTVVAPVVSAFAVSAADADVSLTSVLAP